MRSRLRLPLLALAVTAAACQHAPRVAIPALFPMTPAWTRPVPATIEGPLAADPTRIYVATRDGAVRALDADSGHVRWKVDERPGVVGVGGGLLAVRQEDGTVFGLDAASGAARWMPPPGSTERFLRSYIKMRSWSRARAWPCSRPPPARRDGPLPKRT